LSTGHGTVRRIQSPQLGTNLRQFHPPPVFRTYFLKINPATGFCTKSPVPRCISAIALWKQSQWEKKWTYKLILCTKYQLTDSWGGHVIQETGFRGFEKNCFGWIIILGLGLGKDKEESGPFLISSTTEWVIPRKTSVRIACLWVEIWTPDLPSM
jgi:hypothetical protein